MNRRILTLYSAFAALLGVLFFASVLFVPVLRAQNAGMQQRVADVKEAIAMNKQALAQYTWVETLTIYLKGEQKKQEHFQVRLGPDGKPQKTSLDAPSDNTPQGGRLKRHIIEKKKEEYEEYADRMKALLQRYVPPDKDALQAAYTAGNISITPDAGGSDLVKLAIKNYVQPNDSVTLTFDKGQKQLTQYSVNTYLDDPSDVITLTVNFARVPNGPNHASEVIVESTSKKMKIVTDNSQYNRL